MKNVVFKVLLIVCLAFLCSCSSEEKKPFGAESIDYDVVEGINQDGPNIESEHMENSPPVGDKTTFVEVGPPHIELPDIKVEPTADMEEDPDYGGIPIVTKENRNNGS